jgi:hypothetical protein
MSSSSTTVSVPRTSPTSTMASVPRTLLAAATTFCWTHLVQEFKNRLHKGYGKRLLLHHLSPCSSVIFLSVLALPMNSVVDLSA